MGGPPKQTIPLSVLARNQTKDFWTWNLAVSGSGKGTRMRVGWTKELRDSWRLDSREAGQQTELAWNHGEMRSTPETVADKIGSSEEDCVKRCQHSSCFVEFSLVTHTTCMCRQALAWVTSENSTKQLECRHLLTQSSSLDPILSPTVSGVDRICPWFHTNSLLSSRQLLSAPLSSQLSFASPYHFRIRRDFRSKNPLSALAESSALAGHPYSATTRSLVLDKSTCNHIRRLFNKCGEFPGGSIVYNCTFFQWNQ